MNLFEQNIRNENVRALVDSGIENVREIISINSSCIEFLESTSGVTPEEYDSWRVETFGGIPCLRTIKRKGLQEVARICRETREMGFEALEILGC